jgi:hypothetical protein
MSSEASSAARQLALQRWGTQRLDRLADELADRAAELDPDKRDELVQALVDSVDDGGDAA